MSLLDKFISEERGRIIEELEARIWERLESRIEEAIFSRILTIEDAARYLRVSSQTVRRMIAHGEISAFRARGQWRIRLWELDAWIADQERRRAAQHGPHSNDASE